MGIVHKNKHKHTLGSFICHNSNNYLVGIFTTRIANILIHGHFDFFFFFAVYFLLALPLICYSMSSTIIQRKTSLPVWQTLAGSLAILMWCMDLCVMEEPQCSVNFTEHIRMLVSAKYWKH